MKLFKDRLRSMLLILLGVFWVGVGFNLIVWAVVGLVRFGWRMEVLLLLGSTLMVIVVLVGVGGVLGGIFLMRKKRWARRMLEVYSWLCAGVVCILCVIVIYNVWTGTARFGNILGVVGFLVVYLANGLLLRSKTVREMVVY